MIGREWPAGPRHWLPGHALFEFRRRPAGFLADIAETHGDVVHFRLGPLHAFLLAHPDDVKDVLVTHAARFRKGPAMRAASRLLGQGLLTSEGDLHHRVRRIVQPAFTRHAVLAHGDVVARHALRLAEDVKPGVQEVTALTSRLTLGIAAEAFFGATVDAEAGEVRAALSEILELFDFGLFPFLPLLDWLPSPTRRRFERARARIDATVLGLIARRRRLMESGGQTPSDVLSLLLAARDIEGDGRGLSDAQVRDEAVTIFLAGHETTANLLAWTLLLLAEHEDEQERLAAVARSAVGERLPGVADLPALEELDHAVAESLRLYPPAWAMGRTALEDHDAAGWRIPKGSLVLVSQWVTHRDPRFWPEPLAFRPGRFVPTEAARRPRFAYFPFGGGPRQCLGEGFAWMEAVLALAVLLPRVRVRTSDRPVAIDPVITLRPLGGLWLTLDRR